MNREIEFRGKRKDNGEWVYGYYHKEVSTSMALQEYGINEMEVHYIHTVIDHLPFKIKVIPETIGQYTGFNDKNGKKIFEGDIILIGEKRRKVEVIFKDGQFGYLYNNTCVSFQYQSPEVIGTIFDKEDNNE